MIVTCTTEEALQARERVEGYPTYKRDYLIRNKGEAGPIAFLVEQDPNAVIHPHFHAVNQFQVIVNGGGTLGKREVAPATVQYADAYTGYGPIVSRDEGIFYFTLRPITAVDTKPWYLPEAKDVQRANMERPRNRVGAVSPASVPVTEETVTEIIPSEDDGLRADSVSLPAGGHWAGWEDGPAGGAYVLILSGTGLVDGRELDQWSCAYTDAETVPQVTAGDDGVHFLAMRYPVGS